MIKEKEKKHKNDRKVAIKSLKEKRAAKTAKREAMKKEGKFSASL